MLSYSTPSMESILIIIFHNPCVNIRKPPVVEGAVSGPKIKNAFNSPQITFGDEL